MSTFGFKTPGEFLLAVQRAALHPERVDVRLAPLRAPTIKAAAGSDEHGTYGGPEGGFLVPETWAPNVLGIGIENDPAAGRTMPVEMPTPRVRVSARVDVNHRTSVSGGLLLTRTPETVEVEPQRMTLEQIHLDANTLMGLTFATEDIVMDSGPVFTATLARAYQDEHAAQLLGERLDGTGVGEFLGVLRSPCLITIAKEIGQAGGSIVGDNVIKMAARCWGYDQAVWIANHDARPQIMKAHVTIGTTTHLPLWQGGTDGHPDFLAGRPLFFNEQAKPVGQLGDLVVCNWSQYLDATYMPLQSVGSIHVRFAAHERAFRFTSRNDGAPWWRSPLLPKHSATTLSPFVALEERS